MSIYNSDRFLKEIKERPEQPSLLVGLVVDGEGRAMTPSHATKPGRRYRYYVTRPDMLDGSPAWRVSAHDLEQLVCERLSVLLTDQQQLCDLAGDVPAEAVQQMLAKADLAAANLRSGTARSRIPVLIAIVDCIELGHDGIELQLPRAKLHAFLGLDVPADFTREPLRLAMQATKVRRGHQLRLVIPGPQALKVMPTTRDEKLVALVAEAHEARRLIATNPDRSLAAIAASSNRCRTRLGRLVALSCLAPNIVTAIVEGRQPAALSARSLLARELPLSWANQRAMLGFD